MAASTFLCNRASFSSFVIELSSQSSWLPPSDYADASINITDQRLRKQFMKTLSELGTIKMTLSIPLPRVKENYYKLIIQTEDIESKSPTTLEVECS